MDKLNVSENIAPVDSVRINLHEQILSSVFTKGLISQSKLNGISNFSSADKWVNNAVHGVLVFDPKKVGVEEKASELGYPKFIISNGINSPIEKTIHVDPVKFTTDELLTEALYKNDFSMLPTIAERSWDPDPDPKDIEDRLQNMVMVGTYLYKVQPHKDTSPEVSLEHRVEKIKPEDIAYVVCTESTYKTTVKTLNQVFPDHNIRVMSVKDIDLEVEIGGVRVKKIPNFFETLKYRVLKDSKYPLYFHGVRLPTNEDIKHYGL